MNQCSHRRTNDEHLWFSRCLLSVRKLHQKGLCCNATIAGKNNALGSAAAPSFDIRPYRLLTCRCLERQGLLEQDAESAWLDLDPNEDTDAIPQILDSSD